MLLYTMPIWPGPQFVVFETVALFALNLTIWLFLAFLLAAPAALCFLIAALVKFRNREGRFQNLSCFFACVVLCGLGISALRLSQHLRSAAFWRAGGTGNQVVAALNRFHGDKGKFPESLNELVPEYIPLVPSTGLLGYPEFYYHKADEENDWIRGNAEFELGIECTSGGINFDRFFYWPSEQYPDFIYGGSVERIANWAYVHE